MILFGHGLNDADRSDLALALVLFRYLGGTAGPVRLSRCLELATTVGVREEFVSRLLRTPAQTVSISKGIRRKRRSRRR